MQNNWRPEVLAFADLMEAHLRANDHKPGWKGDSPTALWRRLVQEAGELSQEIIGIYPDKIDRPQTVKEAVDVANFAMMIADVCGALALPPAPSEEDIRLAKALHLYDARSVAMPVNSEIERLREALEPFAHGDLDVSHTAVIVEGDCAAHLIRARAALSA